MKKLFKVLALVLALTLVVGAVPASAASTYNIKAKRTLYVALTDDADLSEPTARGTKTDADGTVTKSTAKARLAYATLLGISKDEAKTHVISVASDNEAVVKANDNTQHIRAYAIGKATLTITVDDKVEGTVVVTAKKSSTDDTITFGEARDVFEDRKVTLNKEYTLSLPRAGRDTDYRKLVIKNEKGEDVTSTIAVEKLDAKGKSLRLWTLKFTAAGKYTIQGFGYQSPLYPDLISTGKVITVEAVKALPERIAQTASNAFTMYFEDGVAVDKNEFSAAVGNYEDSIYELVQGSKVPFGLIAKDGIAYAKDAEGKDIENQIVVTTFKDFEGGKTYYVQYAGKDEPYKFDAVNNGASAVTAVKILKTKVPAGDNYDVQVHAYNGDVDITHALEMENIVTLEGGNDYAWPSGLTVYFSEANRSCAFVASLSKGYDNNGNEVVIKSEPTTIVSYDGAEISDVIYRFVQTNDYAGIESLNQWRDMSKKSVAVDDQGIYLQILVKNAAGNYVTLDDAGVSSVRISNENLAQITTTQGTTATSNLGFSVNASNAGTTSFVLYKERPSDGKEIAAKACEITILPKRQVKEVKVDFDKQQLNLAAKATDRVVYTITVKDQHGEPVKGLLDGIGGWYLSVAQSDNKKNGTVYFDEDNFAATWQAGVYTYTVYGDDVAIADGVKIDNFQLTFKAEMNWWPEVSASKGLTAANKNVDAKSWNVITSGTSLDTNIITDNWAGSQTLKVWGYADGYVVSKENLFRIDEVPTSKLTLAELAQKSSLGLVGDGTYFLYTIKKGSTVVKRNQGYPYDTMNNGMNITGDASKLLTVNNFVVNQNATLVSCGAASVSGAAIKLRADKYTFDFYRLTVDAGKITVNKVGGSQIINVTDNQTAVVAEKVSDSTASVAPADVAKAFKFTLNGVTLTPGDEGNCNVVGGEISLANSGDAFVRNLVLQYYNYRVNGYVQVTVTINKLLDIQ